MKTTKLVTKEVEIVDVVTCNRCGEVATTPSQEKAMLGTGGPRERSWYGLIEASFETGYFSDVLPDSTIYTFSLCEPCVKELMSTFKHPAEECEYP